MAHYYIPEFTSPRDRLKFQAQIEQIWRECGLVPVEYPKNYFCRLFRLTRWYFRLQRRDLIFFIHPLYARTSKLLLRMARRKGCRAICLVSDINSLRGEPGTLIKETGYWKSTDSFIVQNPTMRDFLVARFRIKFTVCLQLFDLLFPSPPVARTHSSRVLFAGNAAKAPFLKLLPSVSGVEWHVCSAHDPNIEGIRFSKLADELSDRRVLEGSYGLIWEGDSVDGLTGPGGQYLRLVTPLKLSNYLLQSLPVIIHQEAAVADFVKRMNVGICVNSLHEIPARLADIGDMQYQDMVRNCRVLAGKLSQGHFTRTATTAIREILQAHDQLS
ncbi:MAG TPA: hypothetical protein VEB63_06665 [Chitinophagaceae bacterium]|nr:hypothetical protein [Chitinophagaceae bacterium]